MIRKNSFCLLSLPAFACLSGIAIADDQPMIQTSWPDAHGGKAIGGTQFP